MDKYVVSAQAYLFRVRESLSLLGCSLEVEGKSSARVRSHTRPARIIACQSVTPLAIHPRLHHCIRILNDYQNRWIRSTNTYTCKYEYICIYSYITGGELYPYTRTTTGLLLCCTVLLSYCTSTVVFSLRTLKCSFDEFLFWTRTLFLFHWELFLFQRNPRSIVELYDYSTSNSIHLILKFSECVVSIAPRAQDNCKLTADFSVFLL